MTNETKIDDLLIRKMQIIAGAVIGGVVFITDIFTMEWGALRKPPAGQMFALIAAGEVLILIVPFVLVPKFVTAASSKPHIDRTLPQDRRELLIHCRVYLFRMVVRYGLLATAALTNAQALIVEHNWWSLAIVGVLVLIMLGMFPTRTKVENFVEQQQMESNL